MNIEAFYRQLLEVEKRDNLFEAQILDKKLWKFLRLTAWAIAYDLGADLFESKGLVKIHELNFLHVFMKRWNNPSMDIFFRDFPVFLHQTDILYFIPGVRREVNGQGINPYIEDYISATPDDVSYTVLEWLPKEDIRRSLNPRTRNLYYVSHEIIGLLCRANRKVSEAEIQLSLENNIFCPIEMDSQIKISSKGKERIVYETIFHLYYGDAYRIFFHKILDRTSPQIVLFYNSDEPYTQILMEVCNQRGIAIAEIQHGTFIGYEKNIKFCSLCNENLVYPSYYVSYGNFTKEILSREACGCKYGLSANAIKPIGRISLDERCKDSIRKKSFSKKRIYLIISNCNPAMAEFSLRLATALRGKEVEIIYKLHPYEYGKSMTNINEMKGYGITVMSNCNLYELIERADFVIGIESTVLYESARLGKMIFIYRNDDVRHPLVEKKIAFRIHSVEELIKRSGEINRTMLGARDVGYFFNSSAKKNYQLFLHNVILQNT